MASDPAFVESVHKLLKQTLVPDTTLLKAATAELQPLLKKRTVIPALFQILATDPDSSVRQLAAVELRKKVANVPKSWKNQPPVVQSGVKSQILEFVLKEENNTVRNSAAHVISAISAIELPENTWPELLPFLFNAVNSSIATQRQMAVFIFFSLMDTFSETEELQQYLPQVMQVFAKTIQDPESLQVQVTTVRALGSVADLLEADAQADLAAMQSSVPQMVQVLGRCLADGNDEGTKHVLDVIDNLAILEAPILTNYIADLVEFLLGHAGNLDLDPDMRVACLNTLHWLCKNKKSKVQQLHLPKLMIERLFPIVVSGNLAEEEDEVEETPGLVALRLLDAIATESPPALVWPTLSEQIQLHLANPDARYRYAAVLTLGMCAEGLSETYSESFDSIWSVIETALKDQDATVRKAGCTALVYICTPLGHECVKHHATAVPMIMQMLADPAVQRDACRALDAFTENLGSEIKAYLPVIMETMVRLLDAADFKGKQSIVATIGSAAHASGTEFRPYFVEVMNRVEPFLSFKDKDTEPTMDLRAAAQDAIGTFAIAVGKEDFRPYFPRIMGVAYEALDLDQPRLKECSFIFFSSMAKIYEDEFTAFLPQVMPKVLESMRQLEHDPVPGASGDGTVTGAGIPGEGGNGEDDDGEEFIDLEDLEKIFDNVSSAICIEKETSAEAVGELFKYTKQGFLPYLQDSVTTLANQLQHFSGGLRTAALTSLFTCIDVLNKLMAPAEWQPGLDIKVPLNGDVQQLVDIVITDVLQMWDEEDETQVAIQFCESLTECINENGPAIIAKNFDKVAEIALSILERRAPVQLDSSAEEAIADDGSGSEMDILLINTAMDLVGALSAALGPDFVGPLQKFFPQISQYYAPTRSLNERRATVATMGELCIGMKASITPFTQDILTLLSRAMSDSEASVRSDATCAAGLLIEHSTEDLSQHYNALLQAIQPSLQISKDEPEEDSRYLRDNAAGCLARLIRRSPDSLPLDQVLPVLFSALPLLVDTTEYAPVLQCCMTLLNSQNAAAMQHADTILQLFAHVLGAAAPEGEEPVISAKLRGQLVAFVSHLNQQAPEKIQAAGLAQYLV